MAIPPTRRTTRSSTAIALDSPALVTGATGFVGSHLLEALAGRVSAIVAWHAPGAAPHDRGRSPVDWRAVDVLDSAAVARAIAATQPAVIFHCAGAADVGSSWTQTYDSFAVNVLGTHRLVEAIRRSDLKPRLLIPGSALVYRQSAAALSETARLGPASPYAVSKLAQEQLGGRFGEEDDQPVLLPRAFTHVGPRQSPSFAASSFARAIARIESGQSPPTISVGNLDASRDLTDVRDTVRAYLALAERGTPGRIYNVCCGRAYRIGDVLDRLLALSRVDVAVTVDPARLRPSDNPVLQGDATRLTTELGWQPRIPLEQTLKDLLDYWRRRVAENDSA